MITKLLRLLLVAPLVGGGPPPLSAQTGAIPPGDNLVTDGVPPVPASIAEAARRYSEFRSAAFWDWHPTRREMLIGTRFGDALELHRVRLPGGARTQLTFFADPVSGASYQPGDGRYIVLSKDVGGGDLGERERPLVGGRGDRREDAAHDAGHRHGGLRRRRCAVQPRRQRDLSHDRPGLGGAATRVSRAARQALPLPERPTPLGRGRVRAVPRRALDRRPDQRGRRRRAARAERRDGRGATPPETAGGADRERHLAPHRHRARLLVQLGPIGRRRLFARRTDGAAGAL